MVLIRRHLQRESVGCDSLVQLQQKENSVAQPRFARESKVSLRGTTKNCTMTLRLRFLTVGILPSPTYAMGR